MTLSRLRVRLTLWYAATFAVILLLLGTGLVLAIGTQVSRRLDASLVAATAAIERATHDLEAERAAGGDTDAVEELHIPDRELYLFDANGRFITPAQADAWIVDAARITAATGRANLQHVTNGGHQLRLHGERFATCAHPCTRTTSRRRRSPPTAPWPTTKAWRWSSCRSKRRKSSATRSSSNGYCSSCSTTRSNTRLRVAASDSTLQAATASAP